VVGFLKVIETRKEISACDIQTVQPGQAIREGDSVIAE
jgi:hypothetical protein